MWRLVLLFSCMVQVLLASSVELLKNLVNTGLAETKALSENGSLAHSIVQTYRHAGESQYCKVCKDSLGVVKHVAKRFPESIPLLLRELCAYDEFDNVHCRSGFYSDPKLVNKSFLSDLINVLSLMDTSGSDGELFCHYILQGVCSLPDFSGLDLSAWWPEKPTNLQKPESSGDTFKVLHLSDIHLSLDYAVGSEGNCIGMMCCTKQSIRDPGQAHFPAPKFGHYNCDVPPQLLDASLAGIVDHTSDYEFAIFTGDSIDHNPLRISYEQSIQEEQEVMAGLKTHLRSTPVYAVLGNHDSYPYGQAAQISSGFAGLFSFNTDLMIQMWKSYSWLDSSSARDARFHYGAYAVTARKGLRIIALNSNFWYRWNFYNYWNVEDPDTSGMLRFLVDELIECEKTGQRAWIIAHIPSGSLNDEVMPLASSALVQIFERFSPETIASIFFGHTHQDQFTVLYTINSSTKSFEDAINIAWIAPSMTPLSHYNPSWRYYEVDSGTFEIMDSVNYYMKLNETFSDSVCPAWIYEYSAREEYDIDGTWPAHEPLNGRFWHLVSEGILHDPDISQKYLAHSYRHSPYTVDCTDLECRAENYCSTTSMSAKQVIACQDEFNIKRRTFLTGGPTYPMPRPMRGFVENT